MSNQTIHFECYPHIEKARLMMREEKQYLRDYNPSRE